mmetsp:Transcript_13997/g.18245  ORF Transcript_13997/g.18245 Transcript_13997/m.18245 type:complete len:414 (+) Transcript_13997:141-1382(+)
MQPALPASGRALARTSRARLFRRSRLGSPCRSSVIELTTPVQEEAAAASSAKHLIHTKDKDGDNETVATVATVDSGSQLTLDSITLTTALVSSDRRSKEEAERRVLVALSDEERGRYRMPSRTETPEQQQIRKTATTTVTRETGAIRAEEKIRRQNQQGNHKRIACGRESSYAQQQQQNLDTAIKNNMMSSAAAKVNSSKKKHYELYGHVVPSRVWSDPIDSTEGEDSDSLTPFSELVGEPAYDKREEASIASPGSPFLGLIGKPSYDGKKKTKKALKQQRMKSQRKLNEKKQSKNDIGDSIDQEAIDQEDSQNHDLLNLFQDITEEIFHIISENVVFTHEKGEHTEHLIQVTPLSSSKRSNNDGKERSVRLLKEGSNNNNKEKEKHKPKQRDEMEKRSSKCAVPVEGRKMLV